MENLYVLNYICGNSIVIVGTELSCAWNIFKINQNKTLKSWFWTTEEMFCYFMVKICNSRSEFFLFSSSISFSISVDRTPNTWSAVTPRAFSFFCSALLSCSSLHTHTMNGNKKAAADSWLKFKNWPCLLRTVTACRTKHLVFPASQTWKWNMIN